MNPIANERKIRERDKSGFWKGNSHVGARVRGLSTDKCPKCKIDLEFRGKEERTLKFRYHRYELFCPKCGQITYIDEGKRRRYADPRRMLGRHAGEIGERIAQNLLVNSGYEIRPFDAVAPNIMTRKENRHLETVKKGSAKLFFGDKYADFIKFCAIWNTDPDVPSSISGSHRSRGQDEEETFSLHRGGLDWVGKKDNKFYLIEVKTNRAVLQAYQKKMLLKAKKFGFIPLVLRIKVKISMPEEEIEWDFI